MRVALASLLDINRALEDGDTSVLALSGGVEGLADALASSTSAGLSSSAVVDDALLARREMYGTNKIEEEPAASFFALFWEASYGDLTMRILLVAAAVSLVVGTLEDNKLGWIEGFAIFLAVFIVAMVTATNDYIQERQFKKLNDVKQSFSVKVLRGGEEVSILVFDVVVGDVVVLERDDAVPADGILIHGDSILLDTSQLNGESVETRVHPGAPFLQSGTRISQGFGTMLVTAVGEHTLWGETLALLSKGNPEPKTPLQRKLHKLATDIGKAGFVFAIIVFLVLTISFLIKESQTKDGVEADTHTFSEILEFIIIAITIVVVAVPEGLPLAVTISLAYSMSKMYKDNNLVRRLVACETMGGATQICSDKTGTLTQNKMLVAAGWYFGASYVDPAIGPPSAADFGITPAARSYVTLLAEGIAVNSSATLHAAPAEPAQGEADAEAGAAPVPGVTIIGSKTEGALLLYAGTNLGTHYGPLRAAADFRKRFSFSPIKKRMSAIVRKPTGGFRLHMKGAAEIVLGIAQYTFGASGEAELITPSKRAELEALIGELGSMGLRVLALGYADYEHDTPEWDGDDEPDDVPLILLALAAIADPVRPEVPTAVGECMDAGITVRMVTGDNVLTASHIARECGILGDGDVAIEGSVFRNMPREEVLEILPRLRVIARCSPKDKNVLVNMLREQGEVVAVTGDGSNDAPALKDADVGLSMGIMGTRLAIDASDIVILDDNFKSIVNAVVWGRGVFDNIRKFLQFQLTVNVVALSLALVAAVGQRGIPLKAVQLLWVNLIMDTMAALALGTEVPTRDLLRRAPYGRDIALISPVMWRNIIGQSVVQLAILIPLLFAGESLLNLDTSANPQDLIYLETLIFNIFVMLQVFNEINARKVNNEWNVFEGFFTNAIFVGVIIITLILQVFLVQVGGRITNTTQLTAIEWLVCIAIGLISLPAGALIRLIPVSSGTTDAQSTRIGERTADDDRVPPTPGSDDDDSGIPPAPLPPTTRPVNLPPTSVVRPLPPSVLPSLPRPIHAPTLPNHLAHHTPATEMCSASGSYSGSAVDDGDLPYTHNDSTDHLPAGDVEDTVPLAFAPVEPPLP
ncbi:plasma membrane calcium ATPase [Thecamonas trahens ATCC 50062]|uniref:Calcium-transporting ATPase n=1 Tax=Thecamonas trahens ATCC 50062 TaxID=461836 RepID=A0A0L0D3T3_THETB|nr:plasma membrane calcium ATPase [Thecamonas trahens ATCC 50062]KNC45963.1 plasma membrane calcium ATPase [Thecamonas trahens ATCC 50062]|eukprot:XP_013762944.1 plasma membrane calcium ATPase [Thecamonas trahens ATCC 50062]